MVLPLLLRNAGTVPVCALEAAIRQGGRRRRAGQAFEWFTLEPQQLFDEDEAVGAASTDHFHIDHSTLRAQLPLPPGGVLCVPVHARLFTPRNWCVVELAYCGAVGGGAAGAAMRAGWHRRASLALSLPRVRPGPTEQAREIRPL